MDYVENSWIMLVVIMLLSTYHSFLFFLVTCKQIARYSNAIAAAKLTLLHLAAAIARS